MPFGPVKEAWEVMNDAMEATLFTVPKQRMERRQTSSKRVSPISVKRDPEGVLKHMEEIMPKLKGLRKALYSFEQKAKNPCFLQTLFKRKLPNTDDDLELATCQTVVEAVIEKYVKADYRYAQPQDEFEGYLDPLLSQMRKTVLELPPEVNEPTENIEPVVINRDDLPLANLYGDRRFIPEEPPTSPYGCAGYPEEYEFLLEFNKISEKEMKKSRRLRKLIRFLSGNYIDPQTAIEKQEALTCLLWANTYLECKIAVCQQVQFKLVEGLTGKLRVKTVLEARIAKVHHGSGFRRLRKGAQIHLVNELFRVEASVLSAGENSMTCVLCCKEPLKKKVREADSQSQIFTIYEIPTDFVPEAMFQAVSGFREGGLTNFIVPMPNFTEMLHEFMEKFDERSRVFAEMFNLPKALTEQQRKAVYMICTKAHQNNPFVLFGPPGTGKTHTISAAVLCLLRQNPETRILICAPSNMAADRVALKIIEDRDYHDVSLRTVLRLRSRNSDLALMDPALKTISLIDSDGQCYIPDRFTRFRLIVTTLGCSVHLAKKEVPKGFFSHIFIDEAGQSSEAELWIPVGCLAQPETSVILCGDPKQLGPVMPFDFPLKITSKFDSPLARLMEFNCRLCVQLVDCFRCHPSIVSIAAGLFYNNTLLPVSRSGEDPLSKWKGLANNDFPVLFVSTPHSVEECDDSKSYYNRVQASAAIHFLTRLINDLKIRPESVGLISPYTAQTRLIRSVIGDSIISGTTVDSVERFQGSERDIIILVTTRTDVLGFMACNLRLNTAITRPRSLLIIIGHMKALKKHSAWNEVIEICRKNKSIEVWERPPDRRIATCRV